MPKGGNPKVCIICSRKMERRGKCEWCKALLRHLAAVHGNQHFRAGYHVDPARKARVALYADRAALKLDIFTGQPHTE